MPRAYARITSLSSSSSSFASSVHVTNPSPDRAMSDGRLGLPESESESPVDSAGRADGPGIVPFPPAQQLQSDTRIPSRHGDDGTSSIEHPPCVPCTGTPRVLRSAAPTRADQQLLLSINRLSSLSPPAAAATPSVDAATRHRLTAVPHPTHGSASNKTRSATPSIAASRTIETASDTARTVPDQDPVGSGVVTVLSSSPRRPSETRSDGLIQNSFVTVSEGATTKRSPSEVIPSSIKNKRMKSTECILFAAALLEAQERSGIGEGSSEEGTERHPSPPGEGSAKAWTLDAKKQPAKRTKGSRRHRGTGNKKIVPEPAMSHIDSKVPASSTTTIASIAPKTAAVATTLASGEALEVPAVQNTGGEVADDAIVTELNDSDVLCGRGGQINRHPGNIVYRKVVDHNKEFYQRVQKKYRILVSQSIVQSILNRGGRFLMMNGNHWTPIDVKKAIQKTSQALRERHTGTAIQRVVSAVEWRAENA